MSKEKELVIDFDFEQFNFEQSSEESEDSQQLRTNQNEILVTQQNFDNELLSKDLIQIASTHLLENLADLQQFQPFTIVKIATSQTVTLISIKSDNILLTKSNNLSTMQNNNIKLLYYNQQFRTSNYQKYFQLIEIPVKTFFMNNQISSIDQNYVQQIFLSQSGLYCLVILQNNQSFLINFYYNKTQQLKYSILHLSKDSTFDKHHVIMCCQFNEQCINSQQNNTQQQSVEVLLGTKQGQMYTFKLYRKDKKLCIDGYQNKPCLVYQLSEFSQVLSCDFQVISTSKLNYSQQFLEEKLGVSSSQCFFKQQFDQSTSENTKNMFIPVNLLNYHKKSTYSRYIIIISSESFCNVIEGRGCCVGDVLLVSNPKDIIDTSGGTIKILSNKYPKSTQYTIQIPSSVRLNVEKNAFFNKNEFDEVNGYTWFCGVQHDVTNKEIKDFTYLDDYVENEEDDDGWHTFDEHTSELPDVTSIHSFQQQISSIAVQCFTCTFQFSINKLTNSCFANTNSIEQINTQNDDKEQQITEVQKQQSQLHQFLQNENNYQITLQDYIQQFQAITDIQTIKQEPPTAILLGQNNFIISYSQELIVINYISKKCCAKIQFEELMNNYIRTTDNSNFQQNTQIIFKNFASEQSFKQNYIYSDKNTFQLYFNDKKDLYKDFLKKNKYKEAIECAENQRQIMEIYYSQAIHSINNKHFNEAGVLLSKTPLQVNQIFSLFCVSQQINQCFQQILLKNNQYVFLNREAIIHYLDNSLKNIKLEQIQNQYQISINNINKIVNNIQNKNLQPQQLMSKMQQCDISNVVKYKQAIYHIFITIFNYLSLINHIYYNAIISIQTLDDDQHQYLFNQNYSQFNILQNGNNKTLKYLQIKQQLTKIIVFYKQQYKQLSTYNKNLIQFIQTYSNYLPKIISRQLLQLSNNNDAYEAFNIAINDKYQLMQFYINQIDYNQKIMQQQSVIKTISDFNQQKQDQIDKLNQIDNQNKQQLEQQQNDQNYNDNYNYYNQNQNYSDYNQTQKQDQQIQTQLIAQKQTLSKHIVQKYEQNYQYINKLFTFQNNIQILIDKVFLTISNANQDSKNDNQLHLIYIYAKKLFQYNPERAFNELSDICFIRRDEVEPLQLLPVFLYCLVEQNFINIGTLNITDDQERQQIIDQVNQNYQVEKQKVNVNICKFLFQSINQCKWQQYSVQNLLIQILVNNIIQFKNTDFKQSLLFLMQQKKEQQCFTYQYALRLLSQYQELYIEKAHLLFTNHKHKQSIQLLIDNKNFILARQLVYQLIQSALEDDVILKKSQELLLNIAQKYLIEQYDPFQQHEQQEDHIIKTLKFVNIQNSHYVKIEQLLLIDGQNNVKVTLSLKRELKNSMADYQLLSEQFKQQTEQSSQSSYYIQQDLNQLRKRYQFIRKNQMCSFCDRKILNDKFLIFNCQHNFHQKCYVQVIKMKGTQMDQQKISKLLAQQQELTEKNFGKDVALYDHHDQDTQQLIEIQIEQLLGKECIYCSVIDHDNEIHKAYLEVNENDWQVVID